MHWLLPVTALLLLHLAENGIKRVDFELCSPLSQGSDFKIQGQQVGTVHAGRGSWLRSKDRICAFQFFRNWKILPSLFLSSLMVLFLTFLIRNSYSSLFLKDLSMGSWLRSKDRICAFQFFIGVGKVKIPKAVNDIPCGTGDGIRIRIIFT